MVFIELSVVLLLILLNGLLAMSELAVVSSRQSRLEQLAAQGHHGAKIAVRLSGDPGRFLATVQIGITLVGVLAGAFGGATLADRLGDRLDPLPGIAPHGDRVAIGIVVVCITYISLILGELVPKRIALASPERIAARVARPMLQLSRVAAPAVWLLKISTDAVLGVLGLRGTRESTVTEEEVKSLISEGVRSGIFAPREREMIEGVLRLADRTVRVIMTPLVWLEENDDVETILQKVQPTRYSRFPVCRKSIDHPLGIVYAKDLLPAAVRGELVVLAPHIIRAPVIYARLPVLRLLDLLQKEGVHTAIVVDEFGVTEGIVTPTDILEAIAGELPERGQPAEPGLVRREDGSWLIDGTLPVDEFEDRSGIRGLREGGFHTMAGLALARLGHIPAVGESLELDAGRLEIVDMDGRRIDKLLFVPAPPIRTNGRDDFDA